MQDLLKAEKQVGLKVQQMVVMSVALSVQRWAVRRDDLSVVSMASQLDQLMGMMLVASQVGKMGGELVEMMDDVMVASMGCNLVVLME